MDLDTHLHTQLSTGQMVQTVLLQSNRLDTYDFTWFAQAVLQHIHRKWEASFITNIVRYNVMSSQIKYHLNQYFLYKLDHFFKIFILD